AAHEGAGARWGGAELELEAEGAAGVVAAVGVDGEEAVGDAFVAAGEVEAREVELVLEVEGDPALLVGRVEHEVGADFTGIGAGADDHFVAGGISLALVAGGAGLDAGAAGGLGGGALDDGASKEAGAGARHGARRDAGAVDALLPAGALGAGVAAVDLDGGVGG